MKAKQFELHGQSAAFYTFCRKIFGFWAEQRATVWQRRCRAFHVVLPFECCCVYNFISSHNKTDLRWFTRFYRRTKLNLIGFCGTLNGGAMSRNSHSPFYSQKNSKLTSRSTFNMWVSEPTPADCQKISNVKRTKKKRELSNWKTSKISKLFLMSLH